MHRLVALAVLSACAYESPSTATVRAFNQAIAARNGDQLDKLLQNPFEYGGIAFRDSGCSRDFATPGTITEDRRGRFLQCLTTLGMQWNPERVMFDTATFEHHGGFTIEARLSLFEKHTRIYWLGYEGRYSADDSLPTISQSTLETLRTQGSTDAPSDPATVARLAREPRTARSTPYSYAIFKVCVSETGETTIGGRYDASSPIAESVLSELVTHWRFRPFLIAGRPVAVCAMTRLIAPKEKAANATTRIGFTAPAPEGFTIVGYEALVRLSTLEASNFRLPLATRSHSNHARVRLCIDGAGAVTRADVVESSGMAAYDALILGHVRKWRYQPYVLDGAGMPICTNVRINLAPSPMAETTRPQPRARARAAP